MYYIVLVVYLVAVSKLQTNWMPILEFPDEGLTIPSLVFPPIICSNQLLECHLGGHNLHCIIWFFEEKNIDCLTLRTIFSDGFQHIHISNIFVREVMVNGIYRYTLGLVFALLDERSSVYIKLQQGCDPL